MFYLLLCWRSSPNDLQIFSCPLSKLFSSSSFAGLVSLSFLHSGRPLNHSFMHWPLEEKEEVSRWFNTLVTSRCCPDAGHQWGAGCCLCDLQHAVKKASAGGNKSASTLCSTLQKEAWKAPHLEWEWKHLASVVAAHSWESRHISLSPELLVWISREPKVESWGSWMLNYRFWPSKGKHFCKYACVHV